MFPQVRAPIENYITLDKPGSKPMKKPRRIWHADSILLDVSLPEENPFRSERSKKRFRVKIQYLDGLDKKKKSKVILFGEPGEYIDDHD